MTRFGKARPSPGGAAAAEPLAQAPASHHPRAPTKLPALSTGRHRPPWTLRTKFKEIVQLSLKPRDGSGSPRKALGKQVERVRELSDEVLSLCLSTDERCANELVEEALQLKPRLLERVLSVMDKAGAVLLADFLRLATHIEDIYKELQSGASQPAAVAKALPNDLALDALRAGRAGYDATGRGKGPRGGASRRSPPPIAAAALPKSQAAALQKVQAAAWVRPATAASAGSRPGTAMAFGSWPPVAGAAWGSRPATGAAKLSRPATAGSRPTTASRMPQPFRTLLLVDHPTEEQATVDGNLARLLSPRLAQVAFAVATANEPQRPVSRQMPLSHRALLKAVSSDTFRSHVAGLLRAEREKQAAAGAWRGDACPEQEAYLNMVQALMSASRGSPHWVEDAEQDGTMEVGGSSPSSPRSGQPDPQALGEEGGPGAGAAAPRSRKGSTMLAAAPRSRKGSTMLAAEPRSRKGSTMPAATAWAAPQCGARGVGAGPELAVEKSFGSVGKPWRAKAPGKASLADSPIILRSLAQDSIVDSFMI